MVQDLLLENRELILGWQGSIEEKVSYVERV